MDRPLELSRPSGWPGPHVVGLWIVVAADRRVEPLGPPTHRTAATDVRDLAGQPQQRTGVRVRSQDCPSGGIEFAVDGRAGCGPGDQVDEHVGVDDDSAHHAVGVGGAAHDRVVAKQAGQPCDPMDRAPGAAQVGLRRQASRKAVRNARLVSVYHGSVPPTKYAASRIRVRSRFG
ncbi:MAG TPA: hypothetical protein VEX15_07305 [Nocardioidaceae bacterium]|nr:hypothetical protein [Nocardioidaceae bacterium]